MYQPFPNFIKLFIPKKEPAPFNENSIYQLKFFSYELKRNFYFSETAYCLNITFSPPGNSFQYIWWNICAIFYSSEKELSVSMEI